MITKSAISKSIILAGLAAMSFVSLAGSAQAYDGRGPHRDFRSSPSLQRHYAPGPQYRPSYHSDRDRHRDRDRDLKRGLAIGLGAAILGGIIAAEANKSRVHRYYE